jgi:hypothetical protein
MKEGLNEELRKRGKEDGFLPHFLTSSLPHERGFE